MFLSANPGVQELKGALDHWEWQDVYNKVMYEDTSMWWTLTYIITLQYLLFALRSIQ